MNRRSFLALTPAFPSAAVTASLVLREEGKSPVELDVNVLRVQPGDTLILSAPEAISAETAARIKTFVEREFLGIRALILSDGLSIDGVVRVG